MIDALRSYDVGTGSALASSVASGGYPNNNLRTAIVGR